MSKSKLPRKAPVRDCFQKWFQRNRLKFSTKNIPPNKEFYHYELCSEIHRILVYLNDHNPNVRGGLTELDASNLSEYEQVVLSFFCRYKKISTGPIS